jgi:2'-5' RNA ligase
MLTDLRQELVPECFAQSHVTVLPPRPISASTAEAQTFVCDLVPRYLPFELELVRLSVFEATSVVFVEIGRGSDELIEMHEALNRGPLAFDEPYDYHPHVTLAQGFPPDTLGQVFQAACRRWEEFTGGSASYVVDHLTFVQNTEGNHWLDLADCTLCGQLTL